MYEPPKRPKLQVVGIGVEEETYSRSTENFFLKVMIEKFPVLRKETPIQTDNPFKAEQNFLSSYFH